MEGNLGKERELGKEKRKERKPIVVSYCDLYIFIFIAAGVFLAVAKTIM